VTLGGLVELVGVFEGGVPVVTDVWPGWYPVICVLRAALGGESLESV